MSSGGEIQIHNYTVNLEKEIGRGGFGNVYKATNSEGQTVAAKKINLRLHANAHIKEAISFYKRPPQHENIIDLYEFHLLRDDFWVFMQYAEHGDLDHYHRAHFPLLTDTKQKILLMKQIACGIAYLHSQNIIHRDIKPANILVFGSHIPEEAVLKITDLGLAKYLEPNAETSGMSSIVGTESFKAPEFWIQNPDGNVHYHRSVDTFSAGLTFQAMLQASEGARLTPSVENTLDPTTEGRLPIGLIMVNRHKAKQTSVNPVADREDDSSLTRGVKQVIRKMVQMIPEHRMPMEDVHRILSCEQTLIRQVRNSYIKLLILDKKLTPDCI